MTDQLAFDEQARLYRKPTKLSEQPDAWGLREQQLGLEQWARDRENLDRWECEPDE